jgi:DNA mismatch repair protein MutS2
VTAASPTARLSDRPTAGTEVSLRGLRADEAEAILERALDAAVLDDLPYLRIIHGKGTGALRDLVQRLLQRDPRVARFGLAPANQGGSGVTVVELR